MSKPIEAGCLAMVVCPHCRPAENRMKVVRVLRRMALFEFMRYGGVMLGLHAPDRTWLCQTEGSLFVLLDELPLRVVERPFDEACLKRLEDFDPAEVLWTSVDWGIPA